MNDNRISQSSGGTLIPYMPYSRAAQRGELLPGDDVRVVLEPGEHDLVSLADVAPAADPLDVGAIRVDARPSAEHQESDLPVVKTDAFSL